MANVDPTPVFLVGMPRAGTTLAQSWLMSTGMITSFPETHVFNQLSTHKSRAKQALGNIRAWWLFAKFAKEARLPRGPRPFVNYHKGAAEITACFAAAAQKDGHAFWLEKTPSHLHDIELIRATVPGARFVVIHRQAAPNIASLIKAEQEWQRQAHRVTPEGAIARWMSDRARVALLEASDVADICVLSYEALRADPSAQATRIGGFLGIDPARFKPLDQLQEEAAKVVTSRETWKANNTAAAPILSKKIDPVLAQSLETIFAAYADEAKALKGNRA